MKWMLIILSVGLILASIKAFIVVLPWALMIALVLRLMAGSKN